MQSPYVHFPTEKPLIYGFNGTVSTLTIFLKGKTHVCSDTATQTYYRRSRHYLAILAKRLEIEPQTFGRFTMKKNYQFTIHLNGTGSTIAEAWKDACEDVMGINGLPNPSETHLLVDKAPHDGLCPLCGSNQLDYSEANFHDAYECQIIYCRSCHEYLRRWFKVDGYEHTDKDGIVIPLQSRS